MTQEQFMAFMTSFKDTIEKYVEKTVERSVAAIGNDINEKIYMKMKNIDDGIKDLREQVKNSDVKQDKMNKRIEQRLNKIEEDRRRESFKIMKSDMLHEIQPTGRIQPSDQLKDREETERRDTSDRERMARTPDPLVQSMGRNYLLDQSQGRCDLPTNSQSTTTMTRSNSWTDEVE